MKEVLEVFDYVDLGDRFAVMRREHGAWKALYYVVSKKEAEAFRMLCRDSTKRGLEFRSALTIGKPIIIKP